MIDASNAVKNEKSFLESMPCIVTSIVALTFICSLMYNHIYFMVLGADISLVPLTMMDYTLTFREYIFFLALVLMPFLPNLRIIRQNYANRQMIAPINRNLGKKTKIILYAICLFSVLPVWTIYNAFAHKNYFFVSPQLLAIFLILIIVSALLFITLSRHQSALFVLSIILIFSIIQLWHISRDNIIVAFENKNYLASTQNKLLILRVLENGFIVSDENYNLSFRYLENKDIIPFKRNEQLAEYFGKYHRPKEDEQDSKKESLDDNSSDAMRI